MISDGPSAKAQLRAAGLGAKKSWGQNFLHDKSVLACMVEADAAVATAPVLELGAGLGALTVPLLQAGAKLVAVERDRELVPSLLALAQQYEGLSVMEADAQQIDYAALAAQHGAKLRVFGNLPYQLSSRILVKLAEAGPVIGQATLLLQREVAERLVAEPPGRTYGLLSVLVQRRFVAELVRLVPPGAFFPAPKVESAVVRLLPRDPLPWPEDNPQAEQQLVDAARAAFRARRKTLRNSLMTALGLPAPQVLSALQTAQIDPQARAETLQMADFVRLGAALFADAQES